MNKSIKTEIIINASKERVWKILTNFASYPMWNPFIISIKGELKASGQLVNTLANSGKNYVFKPKIVSIVENQFFDWLGRLFMPGLFDGHHYFEIDELSPEQVKFTQGEHFSGVLSGYILRKIGDETRNNFIRMNNALKDKAERLS